MRERKASKSPFAQLLSPLGSKITTDLIETPAAYMAASSCNYVTMNTAPASFQVIGSAQVNWPLRGAGAVFTDMVFQNETF